MQTPSSFAVTLVTIVLSWAGLGCQSTGSSGDRLTGVAEDLWGEKIALDHLDRGLTIIQPISPANCGYCLFDGDFVEENYFTLNAQAGGRNFYQCLFNPQRDVYAFLKHYRTTETPVLTYPPALHAHHGDGFPFIEIFKAGEPLYRGNLWPYEETLTELRARHWPDAQAEVALTSPVHMAGRFVNENEQALSIWIIPNGDHHAMERARARLARWEKKPASIKYEGELTAADLQMNLYYGGTATQFSFAALAGEDVPLAFESGSVTVGSECFALQDVGLSACFPNPHNRARYVLCELSAAARGVAPACNWLDYAIYHPGREEQPAEMLLYGHFAKARGNHWCFADSLAFGRAARGGTCPRGACPAPAMAPYVDQKLPDLPAQLDLQRYRVGTRRCHFPAIAVTADGTGQVAWEEEGNIYLAAISPTGDSHVMAIAADEDDSYDVQLAAAGNHLWAVYLAKRDGFYRVYTRRISPGRLSDETLISARTPCDALTPAVVATPDGVAIAWSAWQANQRILRYREIAAGELGEIASIAILPSEIDYTNAWYPALGCDAQGEPWGAWNQHYPATLGVASGNLADEATAVTRLARDEEGHLLGSRDHEKGGYPSVASDQMDRRWVCWESYGWDIRSGQPQRILVATQAEPGGAWSLPQTISLDSQTQLNQTPQIASGPDGGLVAVWSGRAQDPEGGWAIYLSRHQENTWSTPVKISGEDENARAPRMAIGPQGDLWITWHVGTGSEMRIEVYRLPVECT